MKGYMGKFIIVLIMLGMFSMLYIALDQAYDPLHDFAVAQITGTGSVNTVTILNDMWVWLPVGVLFSFFVYSIAKPSKEREVFQ